MDICNIKSVTINDKLLNELDWGETDVTKDINTDDYNILPSMKSNKILYDLLIKKIKEEIEKHNYMNSLLYYNAMVDKDCYTFYDGGPIDFEISIFDYDRKSKYMSLDTGNTLINTFSFVSVYNKSNLMISNKPSNSRYFETIHIPRILRFDPQSIKLLTISNSDLYNLEVLTNEDEDIGIEYKNNDSKKYISEFSYAQYQRHLKQNDTNLNLYTEFMAENIVGDLFYESSKIFVTLPTIIHFDPNQRKYEFAKFARLSDYSLFGVKQNENATEIEYPYYLKYYFHYVCKEYSQTYFHYYSRKGNKDLQCNINNVLVAYYTTEEEIYVLNDFVDSSGNENENEKIPTYKVIKNGRWEESEIDLNKYHKEKKLINKIMFECYYTNDSHTNIYVYAPPTEQVIGINNNAIDARNGNIPLYGFTYKIAGGSNLASNTWAGMCLKLIMDYYSAESLHDAVLIKHLVPVSKLRFWTKGSEYKADDFYKHVYGKPFTTDDEFHLNDLKDFYEICYGLPYSIEIENYIINYFKNIEHKELSTVTDLDIINGIEGLDDIIDILGTFEINSSDYSNIVFKSNRNINNIYIAAYANEYTDFKHVYKHCYRIFNFNDSDDVKTIEISPNITGVVIFFKTKNIDNIDFYRKASIDDPDDGLNNELKNLCEFVKRVDDYDYYKMIVQ